MYMVVHARQSKYDLPTLANNNSFEKFQTVSKQNERGKVLTKKLDHALIFLVNQLFGVIKIL